MQNNRKGFTITELVIVIVVIAILAAVLIPTFVSLIRKANISADTQLAKNLNTALVMDEATNGKPESFSEAVSALQESGFVLANMNPTADGCYLAWESETNQILLVELIDEEPKYKVLFNAKKDYGEPDDSWYFAVKDQATADAIKAALPNVNAELTIMDTTALNTELNADGEKTVFIDGSITTDENNTITLTNPNADKTIDLGSSVINGGSSNSAAKAIPISVEKGKLTLKNGTLNATGRILDADNKVTDIPVNCEPGSYLKIDGTTFNISSSSGAVAGYVCLYGDADVLNATIDSFNCGINAGGGSTVTVENTNMVANYGFFVTNLGNDENGGKNTKLIVKSGTYKTLGNGCSGYMFEMHNGGAEIKGGTFTTKLAEKVFYFYNGGCTLTITGGTFNGKAFANITEADWENMCKAASGVSFDATIRNGVVTITSSK